jgi:hypothetical protein
MCKLSALPPSTAATNSAKTRIFGQITRLRECSDLVSMGSHSPKRLITSLARVAQRVAFLQSFEIYFFHNRVICCVVYFF